MDREQSVTPAAKKEKGRRLQKAVAAAVVKRYPQLTTDDFVSRPMGSPGDDLMLSTAAKVVFPFSVEAKNQERLNIWGAIAQAEARAVKSGLKPLVVFSRNRSPVYVTLELTDFLGVIA